MQIASKTSPPKNVDAYIRMFPASHQPVLEKMRQTIKASAPGAEEVISYRMPAYNYHGMLVYFAGWKSHIGFYPTGRGIEAFKKELSGYEGAKGTVKFPLDKPVPFDLISKIVKFRVKENLERAEAKARKK